MSETLFGSPALADDDMLPGLARESTFIPVELASGSSAKLEAMVVRPDRPGQLPLVLIVHGTPRNLANIVYMSPIDYLSPAVDFAIRGYAAVSIMRRGLLSSGRANLAQTAIRTKPWPPVVCCEAQLGCAAPTNPVCGSSGSAMSWISVTEYPGGPTMR